MNNGIRGCMTTDPCRKLSIKEGRKRREEGGMKTLDSTDLYVSHRFGSRVTRQVLLNLLRSQRLNPQQDVHSEKLSNA